MDATVQGLHLRMGQERHLVACVSSQARSQSLRGIADGVGKNALLLTGGTDLPPHLFCVDMRVRALVPLDIERGQSLPGGPRMVADDGHEILQDDDLADAGELFGLSVIYVSDLAPKHRTDGNGCEVDSGREAVPAMRLGAVARARLVQPADARAKDIEAAHSIKRNLK